MRMIGIKSIALAAGLAMLSAGTANAAPQPAPIAPVSKPIEAAPTVTVANPVAAAPAAA
ncbi:cytochrome c oxidase subunit II, partial [Sphingomonas sp. HMWF008]